MHIKNRPDKLIGAEMMYMVGRVNGAGSQNAL